MASFFETVGPGMLSTGFGIYQSAQEKKEAEERLRRAQGPLYDQLQQQAGLSLNLAGGLNPRAHAAERFGAQQALVAPGQEADRLALMRQLTAKGMLGAASYAPVAGAKMTPGVAVNPQMAALLAAQEGAKERASYDSLREGEEYLDRLLNRSGRLQTQAQTARSTGQAAMSQIPRAPSVMQQVLGGLFKTPEAAASTIGMLGKGINYLFNPKDSFPADATDMADAVPAPSFSLGGMLGRGVDWLAGLFS